MTSLTDELLALEKMFMVADLRRNPEELALLTNDFVEYGSSGRVFGKKEVLAVMRESHQLDFAVEEFRIRTLAPGCMLATYRVSIDGSRSLRSSIWIEHGGEWKMAFHQGTLMPEATH